MNLFYLTTAFLCGAAVMIVEIVGTKFLSPLFGSGIFVWSSSITIAMLALSIGYFLGGKNADSIKENLDDYLFKVVIVASLLIFSTPKLSKLIFYVYDFLDVKLASFLSSFLLFFPALVALGMISPIVTKLIAKNVDKLGKDLGFIYAISTFGSLIGALLGGFVLLVYFSAKEIFIFTGIILFLISIVHFLLKKKYKYGLITILFFIIGFSNPLSNLKLSKENRMDDKMVNVKLVDKKDTFYGRVDVVDLESKVGKGAYRVMLVDGVAQGLVDREKNKSVTMYSYVIEEIIRQQKMEDSKKVLFVGVGMGVMPNAMKEDYHIEMVDINPIVVEFAKKYFNLNKDVNIQDARIFLNKQKYKNDAIVIDVFSGETIPAHLLTKEFMKLMSDRLSDDGLIVFNIVGNPYEGFESKAIIKTINSEFKHVNILPLVNGDEKNINYVVTASKKEITLDRGVLVAKVYEKMATVGININNMQKITFLENLNLYKDGEVLTDEKNKIDFYRTNLRDGIKKNLMGILFKLENT